MDNFDERFMRLALDLAEKARGRTSPNPMVGAVIVQNGKIVGQGYHEKAGAPHAEIHSIGNAGEMAKGGTLYVTLEPCCHYGRTGPCTEAIVKAGISRVVISMIDPNPKVSGKGKAFLENHGVEVRTGVLKNQALKLNEVFIKYITTGCPFVILKTAMSLDGKIATASGQCRWISCEGSRAMVHKIRDEVDGIMVGIGTVIKDDPSLTTRLPDGKGHDPVRIVLDSRARIPLNSKVLNIASSARTIVAVTSQAPEEKINQIREKAEVLIMPENNRKVDLKALMKELGSREITSILLEGGAEVNASALKAGIVDKVMFFIAPKIIGGKNAPGPIGGEGIQEISESFHLRELSLEHIGDDLLVTGYIGDTSQCLQV